MVMVFFSFIHFHYVAFFRQRDRETERQSKPFHLLFFPYKFEFLWVLCFNKHHFLWTIEARKDLERTQAQAVKERTVHSERVQRLQKGQLILSTPFVVLASKAFLTYSLKVHDLTLSFLDVVLSCGYLLQ